MKMETPSPNHAPVPNLADLKAGLRGPLLLPGERAYEEARRVFNGLIDRHPAAIAQCTGTADVVHAVNFGRSNHMRVSVKGGGHNVAGLAVSDGGLVIDLARMRSVFVDPTRRTVGVQGGATWAEVDRETQLFGLATPGGLVSSTGVAGFTLGGGIGWLAREHGLASDNLVGAEVVLANGSVVTATASENPDLLWALRGGGGNFGVVTRFELRLHEVGPVVYGGALFYRRDRAVELLERYGQFAAAAPEKLTTLVVMLTGPPAPFLPPETHGQPMIAFAACYDGNAAEGESALRPLREALGAPVADLLGPIPYTALQSMFDASAPPGRLHYWKSHHLRSLDRTSAAALVHAGASVVSPFTEIHVHQLGGRSAREPSGGSAYSNRRSPFILNLIGQWTDPAETAANTRWVRETWDALRPHATGEVYVNFLAETDVASIQASYGGEQFRRLAELKARYDPDNLFRATHNVPPPTNASRGRG